MTWKCLNELTARRLRDHLYFVRNNDGRTEYAVADWSLQKCNDPSTTEDGLLLVDPHCKAVVSLEAVRVPVIKVSGKTFDERRAWVWSSTKQISLLMHILHDVLCMEIDVDPALKDLAAALQPLLPDKP